jgi:hypothetical protein
MTRMAHDLVRPPKARRGDRIAVLSPSFAAARPFPAVHEQAMRRLTLLACPSEVESTQALRQKLISGRRSGTGPAPARPLLYRTGHISLTTCAQAGTGNRIDVTQIRSGPPRCHIDARDNGRDHGGTGGNGAPARAGCLSRYSGRDDPGQPTRGSASYFLKQGLVCATLVLRCARWCGLQTPGTRGQHRTNGPRPRGAVLRVPRRHQHPHVRRPAQSRPGDGGPPPYTGGGLAL